MAPTGTTGTVTPAKAKAPSPPPATSASGPAATGSGSLDDADEGDDYLVRYASGRLTVDVLDMPLRDLLNEVGRQSGARVRADGLEGRTVSDTFTRLPLDQALRRMVADKNFSVIYAKERDANGRVVGRRLKELHVYGADGPAGTASARPKQPTAAGLTTRPVAQQARPDAREARRAAREARANDDGSAEQPLPGDDDDTEAAEARVRHADPAVVDDEGFEDAVEPAVFTNPVTAAILGNEPDSVEEFYDEPEIGWEDEPVNVEDWDGEGFVEEGYGEPYEPDSYPVDEDSDPR